MNDWLDGWIHGWMDGWMEGRVEAGSEAVESLRKDRTWSEAGFLDPVRADLFLELVLSGFSLKGPLLGPCCACSGPSS